MRENLRRKWANKKSLMDERQRDTVGEVYGRIEEAVCHPGLSAELRLEAGELQATIRRSGAG